MPLRLLLGNRMPPQQRCRQQRQRWRLQQQVALSVLQAEGGNDSPEADWWPVQ